MYAIEFEAKIKNKNSKQSLLTQQDLDLIEMRHMKDNVLISTHKP